MINIEDKGKLIVSFLCGSHLYGNATENSDEDTRGVFIPPAKYFMGFNSNVKQLSDNETDTIFHEIRHFFTLAVNNNPNIIEFLFVPEKDWINPSRHWARIVENRHLFLSTKARWTFSGYAYSQLKRIKRHRGWLLNPPKKKPERKDYGLLEGKATVPKEQIGAFNVLLSKYLEETRKFHFLREQIEVMEETHNFKTVAQQIKEPDYNAIKELMPISDNFIEALEREKAYINAKSEWDKYQNWKKNRNEDRSKLEAAYGYDTKHASHLFRLMEQGEELLTTGHITFPRPNADFLLDVKNGILTYDELIESVSDFDEKFEYLYNNSILPKKPKIELLDKLCIDIVDSHFTEEIGYEM